MPAANNGLRVLAMPPDLHPAAGFELSQTRQRRHCVKHSSERIGDGAEAPEMEEKR